MNIYKFDKYKINEGIILEIDCIVDNRINEKTYIPESLNIDIVSQIFLNNNINSLINKRSIKSLELKRHFEVLNELDIVKILRPYSKKIIYKKNFFNLLFSTLFSYILRMLPFVLVATLSAFILKMELLKIVFVIFSYFLLSIVHEFGHMCSYYFLNNRKLQCYFIIKNFSLQLVVPEINKSIGIIVALCGPLLAIFLCIILILLTQNVVLYFYMLLHGLMLLPFFDDGKQIWS